jgi:hypothetical protein
LRQRNQLVALLTQFLTYTGEQIEEFHLAVQKFKDDIPELARGLMARIAEERVQNKRFVVAFDTFQQICRASIDPDISVSEIEEMLVQHLLTERLFRTVFDDPDFTNRNVIATEIEKVIRALTSRSFNRSAFLKSLDYFYVAIEEAARTINDYTQKQTFLNTVYERFFQGFSKDQADTHGIVYTPQPIVDFMINSVDEVLQQEFGLSLSSEGVKILDPATGTDLAAEIREYYVPDFRDWKNHDSFEKAFAQLLEGLKAVDALPAPRIEAKVSVNPNTSKQRHLKILEDQQARMGVLTPPHIIMEIEDLRHEIGKLESNR